MNKIIWFLGVALMVALAPYQIATAGTVSGVVKDNSGNVIQNATIEVQDVGFNSYYGYTVDVDTNGMYSITFDYAGYYVLKANSTNPYGKNYYYTGDEISGPAPEFVKPFFVATNGSVTINPIIETGFGSITGKATYSDGTAGQYQTVNCYNSSGEGQGFGYIGSDGNFSINHLAPGNDYACSIYTETVILYYKNTTDWALHTPIVVNANTTTSGIDFTIPKTVSSNKVVVVPLMN